MSPSSCSHWEGRTWNGMKKSRRKEGNILDSLQGTQKGKSLPQNSNCVVEDCPRTGALQPRALGLHLTLTTALNHVYSEDCSQYVLSPIVWLSQLFQGWISRVNLFLPLSVGVMTPDRTGRRTFLWHRKMNNIRMGISMNDMVNIKSVNSGMIDDSPLSIGLFWKIPYLSEVPRPDFGIFLKVHVS